MAVKPDARMGYGMDSRLRWIGHDTIGVVLVNVLRLYCNRSRIGVRRVGVRDDRPKNGRRVMGVKETK